MADTYRQVREAINEEIRPYKHLGAAASFKEDGDKVRCLIAWRGKSRVVYFMRYTTRMHAVQSIIADVRREMRALGVIVDKRQRTGTLGEVFIDAVKRHSPELVSVKPPPPPEEKSAMTEIATTNVTQLPRGLPALAAQPPKKLSHQEVAAITKLCMRSGTEGTDAEGRATYAYNPGWDDERVRTEIKTEAALETVAKVRRDNMGRLPPELKPKVAKADHAGRIEALDGQLAAMDARLKEVEAIVAQLK